jgi:hypothetical protein
MKFKKHILITFIIALSLPAQSSVTPDVSAGFTITFGPWQNDSNTDIRTRPIYLNVMNNTINTCLESTTGGRSDIILSCPFIKPDEDSGWVLDKEAALTILYHNSGMNRDGSARYFWHEWFGII